MIAAVASTDWEAEGSMWSVRVLRAVCFTLLVWPASTVTNGSNDAAAGLQAQLRDAARDMFKFGWRGYMDHAFPADDLRPLSCTGHNTQGGFGNTLVDSLDTLLVMGEGSEFASAAAWAATNLTFDIDRRVHTFELTIRALGGLLSAHVLVAANPGLLPGYDGGLLSAAVDLADRLMPAFDTPTGIPLSWVNLRRGVLDGEIRETCTACATTLLLEFGYLSHLTGNRTYGGAAARATGAIFGRRSAALGLPGNTVDCDSGDWVRGDSGIGAGLDSYYEYLLKAYLMFGDETSLTMYAEAHAAANATMRLVGELGRRGWLVDVHMATGQLSRVWVSSLAAFWPGLQALAGQTESADRQLRSWMEAWNTFGWLPELFDVGVSVRHPMEKGYPLRPELIESTFLMHSATGDDKYLQAAHTLQDTLLKRNRGKCGYASVSDVESGVLEDTMESFFLSETAKYLFLLGAGAGDLPDFFVLTTEGHLLPPLPATAAHSAGFSHLTTPDGAGTTMDTQEAGSSLTDNAPPSAAPRSKANHTDGSHDWPHSHGSSGSHSSEAEATEAATLAAQQGGTAGQAAAAAAAAARNSAEAGTKARPGGAWSYGGGAVPVPPACLDLCRRRSRSERAAAAARLRAALPLVPLNPESYALLRRRRCRACIAVEAAVAMRAQSDAATAAAAAGRKSGAAGPPEVLEDSPRIMRQVLCRLEEDPKTGALCREMVELMPGTPFAVLPPDSLVLQLATEGSPLESDEGSGEGHAPAQYPKHVPRLQLRIMGTNDTAGRYEGLGAGFGPLIEFPPHCWDAAVGAGGDVPLARRAGEECAITGRVVMADPVIGCSPQQHPPARPTPGKASDQSDSSRQCRASQDSDPGCVPEGSWILVAQRGECSFAAKVAFGQAAGASAVVIGNYQGTGNELIEMGGDYANEPTIPSVSVTTLALHRIRAAARAAAAGGGWVEVHLEPLPGAQPPVPHSHDDGGQCAWDPDEGSAAGGDEVASAKDDDAESDEEQPQYGADDDATQDQVHDEDDGEDGAAEGDESEDEAPDEDESEDEAPEEDDAEDDVPEDVVHTGEASEEVAADDQTPAIVALDDDTPEAGVSDIKGFHHEASSSTESGHLQKPSTRETSIRCKPPELDTGQPNNGLHASCSSELSPDSSSASDESNTVSEVQLSASTIEHADQGSSADSSGKYGSGNDGGGGEVHEVSAIDATLGAATDALGRLAAAVAAAAKRAHSATNPAAADHQRPHKSAAVRLELLIPPQAHGWVATRMLGPTAAGGHAGGISSSAFMQLAAQVQQLPPRQLVTTAAVPSKDAGARAQQP